MKTAMSTKTVGVAAVYIEIAGRRYGRGVEFELEALRDGGVDRIARKLKQHVELILTKAVIPDLERDAAAT